MKVNTLILLFTACLLLNCKNEPDTKIELITATLKGEVIDRDSKVLLLTKSTEDARTDSDVVKIPIENGKFEYEFLPKDMEAYELIFEDEYLDGGWRPTTFFPEKGITTFTLYPMDRFSENKMSNNGLNENLNNFKQTISSEFDKKNKVFYEQNDKLGYNNLTSKDYKKINKKLSLAKNQEERVPLYEELRGLKNAGLDRSELGKKRDSIYEIISNEYLENRYKYIEDNPSLVSFHFLIEDLMFRKERVGEKRLLGAFQKLKKQYPEHRYTKLGDNLFRALNDLKPGGQYVDFSAPDIKGNTVEFKTVLEQNKIVLLDLWATWCGPCIAKTRLARPIYEKYKDKGFTILGVAGERRNLEAYNNFMKKEQWPWLQLLEIGNKNNIWEKYNIKNTGGGMFLVDSSGEILAVDPKADELDKILSDRL